MRYRVEMFDRMQLCYDQVKFNDHQVHCQMTLRGALEESALRRAVALSLRAFPILATRYCASARDPFWESLPEADLERAFAAVEDEGAFEKETTLRLDEREGPQVRVTMLRGDRPRLTVTMNHMIADGASFKDYLYFVSGTYSALVRDAGGAPVHAAVGDRGTRDVLRHFRPAARLRALVSKVNAAGSVTFPFSDEAGGAPIIAHRTMDRKSVDRLRDFCREHHATLNDAVLTAFYRVLARLVGSSAGEIQVPIMVDLRRFLPPEARFSSLRNLASMVITRVPHRPGEGFEETLHAATAATAALKAQDIGLGGLAKLSLLFALCGPEWGQRLLRRGLRPPRVCMTNIGELDASRLSFRGAEVTSAFACGSIKYKPHFQLAVSGFHGTLTLSSNVYGSPEDRRRVEAFLQEVERELVGVPGSLAKDQKKSAAGTGLAAVSYA